MKFSFNFGYEPVAFPSFHQSQCFLRDHDVIGRLKQGQKNSCLASIQTVYPNGISLSLT